MKRLTTLLIALSCFASVYAEGGVRFEKNMTWAQIKAKAAREKKMIFFDAFTTWCGPCKYLENNVYTDASVAAYFNENFINVKFDMEDGEGVKLADEFEITSYPTLLFFSPSGKLVHKSIGAVEAPKFIILGKEAKDPARQYYTLKQKVAEHKASTDEFVKWTAMADDLDDDNRGAVSSGWLSAQGDILGSAELAKAILLYSEVDEKQLGYLYQHTAKIKSLLGWDDNKVQSTLYRKLFSMALEAYKSGGEDNAAFTTLIKKFQPLKVTYAQRDLEMLIALNIDRDSKKAMSILTSSLSGTNRITLEEMTALLIDYSPRFENDDITSLIQTLENYKLSAYDKGQECWLYLAQVISYSKAELTDLVKLAAQKAYDDKNLPEEYRNILKESYGL